MADALCLKGLLSLIVDAAANHRDVVAKIFEWLRLHMPELSGKSTAVPFVTHALLESLREARTAQEMRQIICAIGRIIYEPGTNLDEDDDPTDSFLHSCFVRTAQMLRDKGVAGISALSYAAGQYGVLLPHLVQHLDAGLTPCEQTLLLMAKGVKPLPVFLQQIAAYGEWRCGNITEARSAKQVSKVELLCRLETMKETNKRKREDDQGNDAKRAKNN